MRPRRFLFVYLLLPLFGLFLSAVLIQSNYYQIEECSKLNIKGTSNVTDFTCQCLETFPKSQLSITASDDGTKAIFDHTVLQIRTKKLDCGNKPMNNDMYNTLKADEHPFIQIKLLETKQSLTKTLDKSNDWVPMEAQVEMTIAGVSRQETLTIQGKKLDDFRYRFKSSKKLLMTDFGLKPPRALMGLIKVSNEIAIELDLTVSVLQQM